MTTLSFQPVNEADIDALIALWRACKLTKPQNDPAKDIAFAHDNANSDVLVARLDSKLVASVMVGHDGHRGMVYYVAVAPDCQAQGFGKQAMKAAESWLKAHGVWKLNLLVRAENEAVRGFYEALGYQIEPRLCMARKLLSE